MNQPVWRLLEPHVPLKRRYQRALVLAFHGGYAALLVFWLPQLSTPVLQAAYFALLACWLLIIFMTTGFVQDKRENILDERQRSVCDRAHRYAYLWLAGVALIIYWTSGDMDNGTLAMYALLSYAALPSSVIAWLEPDPPAPDSIAEAPTGEENHHAPTA